MLPNRIYALQPEPCFPLLGTIRAPRTPESLCIYPCHLCRLDQLRGGNRASNIWAGDPMQRCVACGHIFQEEPGRTQHCADCGALDHRFCQRCTT
eukprot:11460178-Alexandrium_andersonii.AAC.1